MENQNVSYREPLCEYDNKGVKFFSPLCNPNVVQLLQQQQQQQQQSFEQERRSWNDIDCKVPPVHYPKPQVKQFTDKESAFDWFKDPTYSQRAAAKKQGIDDSLLETNPSLIMYHKLKLQEKVAGSLMQSL